MSECECREGDDREQQAPLLDDCDGNDETFRLDTKREGLVDTGE